MKTMKKLSAILLTMVLCIASMAIPAFASSVSQDGLNIVLTTDKEEYAKAETIVATLSVENANDFAVTDVSLKGFIPEGYKLAADSTALLELEALEAGETKALTFKLLADVPATENPDTGDSSNTAMWAVLLIISGMGAAMLFVYSMKNKKAQKVLSLALCLAVAGGTIGGIAVKASAAEAESKTAAIETTVKVNGADLAIKGEVAYTLPETDEGMIVGKVCQAGDRVTPIENATVSFSQDGVLVAEITTDAEGAYALALAAGEYAVQVSAEGFLPFNANVTITSDDTVYLETFFLIAESEDEDGIASGKITDAFTGSALAGVNLEIRGGWGNTSGEVIETAVTDANGNYSVTLPLGNYTMHATKSGYIAVDINITVNAGETPNQNGTMTPVVADGEWRIVLTWGENPHDLDAHVRGKLSDGSDFHTYFGNKMTFDGDVEVCNLDVDDRISYGPETVTIRPTSSAPYYYYIDNYSETDSYATSGAQIKVYRGDTLVATYNAPTNMGEGFCWNVFAIVDGEIVVSNTITEYAPNTEYANASAPEAVIEETTTTVTEEATTAAEEETTEAVTTEVAYETEAIIEE